MSHEQIARLFEQLGEAMRRDDDVKGREALLELGLLVVSDLHRIADSMQTLASPRKDAPQ